MLIRCSACEAELTQCLQTTWTVSALGQFCALQVLPRLAPIAGRVASYERSYRKVTPPESPTALPTPRRASDSGARRLPHDCHWATDRRSRGRLAQVSACPAYRVGALDPACAGAHQRISIGVPPKHRVALVDLSTRPEGAAGRSIQRVSTSPRQTCASAQRNTDRQGRWPSDYYV